MRPINFYKRSPGRKPQNESTVPFKYALPLALRNKVTGKGSKLKERGCLHEMTVVLACLEQHNYEEKFCSKQVSDFHQCYSTFLKNSVDAKDHARKGILTPNSNNLRYNQINQLLQKYPHV